MQAGLALLSVVLTAAHVGLRGPLVDASHEVRVTPAAISLVSANGDVSWRWRTPPGTTRAWFMSAGDLDGDRSPDVVVAVFRPLLSAICGFPQVRRLAARGNV